jgi:quercetin dioxygenase-like cupin family protein
MVRLQGESKPLRDAVVAYQATTEVLAAAVAPVTPPRTLRERLINRIASEAAHEAEQFEVAANTLALSLAPPVRARDSVRKRLLSRIEEPADIRLDVGNSAQCSVETPVQTGDGLVGEGGGQFPHDGRSSPFRQPAQAWRHLIVTVYTSLRLCWNAFVNLLRSILVRSGTADRSRPLSSKIGYQQSGKGLTFIKAVEGVWREIAPGVKAKVLSFDLVARRATTLVRIDPGTSYAPHRHTEAEELFVLEGGCLCGGRELTAGDYHRAEAGTEHYDTSSDDGCLLLVISSPQNEMIS